MQVKYKNKRLETVLIGINVLTAALVTSSFVLLFGFDKPLLPAPILYSIQFGLLFAFITEKIIRLFNLTQSLPITLPIYRIPLSINEKGKDII